MSIVTINVKNETGAFAENKDVAKKIRENVILPALNLSQDIYLDFEGVTGATQSFIHALISDPIRNYRDIAFDHMYFKNANATIRQIISIVYRYMQESLDIE